MVLLTSNRVELKKMNSAKSLCQFYFDSAPRRNSRLLYRSPTPAAVRFNPDAFAAEQARAELRRHLLNRSITVRDESPPPRPVRATRQSPWSTRAPVGQQRDLAVCEHFNLADNAVAAAKSSFPAAPRPQRLLSPPHQILVFQLLGRRFRQFCLVVGRAGNPRL